MSKKNILGFFLVFIVGIVLSAAVYWQSERIAMLDPKGVIAEKELDLMILATLLMLVVVVPVFILTFYISWKYREENTKAIYSPDWNHSHLAEAVWWGFPLAIVAVLSVIAWESSHELDPYKPIQSETKPLTIQVVALQWKWLFIYPEQKIASVNYAQIPENTPINFEVSADAPMNSFWVPQLGGQIYAMPGMKSQLHLIAEKTGSFSGSSANISGEGFSGMTFEVKSTSSDDFDQWAKTVRQSSPPLQQDSYQALAKPSKYAPPTTYSLQKEDLFHWIVMKPMMPTTTSQAETENHAHIQPKKT